MKGNSTLLSLSGDCLVVDMRTMERMLIPNSGCNRHLLEVTELLFIRRENVQR